MRIKKPPKVRMNFWLRPILLGLKILDELMSKHEFFKSNPSCRHALLKKFINKRFNWTLKDAQELLEEEIYSTIKDEFEEKLGEYDVLIPALCAALYNEKNNDTQIIDKFSRYFTARVDMKKDTTNDLKMTYGYAEGKYNHFVVAVGKMPNYSCNDEGLTTDEYFSGGRIEIGNKVKAILEAGRWNINNFGNASIAGSFANDEVANYQGVQVNYTGSKLFLGAGYRRFASEGFKNLAGYSKNNDKKDAKLVSIGAGYKFGDFRLFGAFAKNTESENYKTSHNIEISYKGAKRNKPGSWGIYGAYRYISPFVTIAPTYDTMGFAVNRKGWETGVSYAPLKNLAVNVSYFGGKQLDTNRNSNTLWARARFWF